MCELMPKAIVKTNYTNLRKKRLSKKKKENEPEYNLGKSQLFNETQALSALRRKG
jgi:hypothetical protein